MGTGDWNSCEVRDFNDLDHAAAARQTAKAEYLNLPSTGRPVTPTFACKARSEPADGALLQVQVHSAFLRRQRARHARLSQRD